MREQKNTFAHSVALNFLLMLVGAGLLSSSINNTFGRQSKDMVLEPFEVYHRKKVNDAGSIYPFLDNTVDKAQGICNVDKAKLPTYQAFIFDRVSVGYSTTTNDNNAGKELYNSDMLAELRNCDFVIEQNGRIVLEIPLAALHNPHQTTGTNIADQYAQLGSFRWLADEFEFEWKLKFPKGVTVPDDGTNYHYLEIKLNGWRTNKKARA